MLQSTARKNLSKDKYYKVTMVSPYVSVYATVYRQEEPK